MEENREPSENFRRTSYSCLLEEFLSLDLRSTVQREIFHKFVRIHREFIENSLGQAIIEKVLGAKDAILEEIMADMSEERIREAVSKALAEVRSETESNEAAVFKVQDLQAQAAEFFKIGGSEVAWEVSYKTVAAAVERGTPIEGGPEVAWEVTYKTVAAAVERGIPTEGRGSQ